MAQQNQTQNRPQTPVSNEGVHPAKSARGTLYGDDVSRFAVTIGRPREEVFRFWRQLENLALFMKDVKEVRQVTPKKSHWAVELKSGFKAEWDADIVSERENEMISWKSTEGSEVKTSGTVWFRNAPSGRGTVVSLVLDYKVPGGKLTEFLTTFTGENPDFLAHINLRRLKAYLETGEVPTIHGQPSGRDEDLEPQSRNSKNQH